MKTSLIVLALSILSSDREPDSSLPVHSTSSVVAQAFGEIEQGVLGDRDGAWVMHVGQLVTPSEDDEFGEIRPHLHRLVEKWESSGKADDEWLRVNEFNLQRAVGRHPLLASREGFRNQRTEYLYREGSRQMHTLEEDVRTDLGVLTRKTREYRQDDLVVLETSLGGRPAPARVSHRKDALSLGGLVRVRNFLRMVRSIEDRASESGKEGSDVVLPLMTPVSREFLSDFLLPIGFERIPGDVAIEATVDEDQARISLVWRDALGLAYSREALTVTSPDEFRLVKKTFFPGTDEVAQMQSVAVLRDESRRGNSLTSWSPTPGMDVEDHRPSVPTRYRVKEDGALMSLTELEKSHIYHDEGRGDLKAIPKYDERFIEDSILIGESRRLDVEFGLVPFGDTPFRIELFNTTEEFVTIVATRADCGCVNVTIPQIGVGPSGMSVLEGTLTVRSNGEQARQIGIDYISGESEEVKSFTVNLSYDCNGRVAVQPDHLFLGTRVAGEELVATQRVLLPRGSDLDDLEVSWKGQPLRTEFVREGDEGQFWVAVTVPLEGVMPGARDFHLDWKAGSETARSVLSASIAPNADFADDWPAWRVPLSKLGQARLLYERFGELQPATFASESAAGFDVALLSGNRGLIFETRGVLDEGVEAFDLETAFGPLRILVQ